MFTPSNDTAVETEFSSVHKSSIDKFSLYEIIIYAVISPTTALASLDGLVSNAPVHHAVVVRANWKYTT